MPLVLIALFLPYLTLPYPTPPHPTPPHRPTDGRWSTTRFQSFLLSLSSPFVVRSVQAALYDRTQFKTKKEIIELDDDDGDGDGEEQLS